MFVWGKLFFYNVTRWNCIHCNRISLLRANQYKREKIIYCSLEILELGFYFICNLNTFQTLCYILWVPLIIIRNNYNGSSLIFSVINFWAKEKIATAFWRNLGFCKKTWFCPVPIVSTTDSSYITSTEILVLLLAFIILTIYRIKWQNILLHSTWVGKSAKIIYYCTHCSHLY